VFTVPTARYDLPDEGESQRSRYSRNIRVPQAAEFSDQRARTERSDAGASSKVSIAAVSIVAPRKGNREPLDARTRSIRRRRDHAHSRSCQVRNKDRAHGPNRICWRRCEVRLVLYVQANKRLHV